MARTPARIAPPRVIADAASALYGQIETSAAIPDDKRDRWVNAVTRAFTQLMEGVRFNREEDGTFVFPSRTRSGLGHRVNGSCTCEAAEDGEVCWARAAKRLVLMIEERGGGPSAGPGAPPAPAPAPQPPAPPVPQVGKHIVADPAGGLRVYYDGELVGPAASRAEAELAVEQFLAMRRAEGAPPRRRGPGRRPAPPRPLTAPGRDAQEEVDELFPARG